MKCLLVILLSSYFAFSNDSLSLNYNSTNNIKNRISPTRCSQNANKLVKISGKRSVMSISGYFTQAFNEIVSYYDNLDKNDPNVSGMVCYYFKITQEGYVENLDTICCYIKDKKLLDKMQVEISSLLLSKRPQDPEPSEFLYTVELPPMNGVQGNAYLSNVVRGLGVLSLLILLALTWLSQMPKTH